MNGTKVALLIGGAYLLSKGTLGKALTTSPPGQQTPATKASNAPGKGTGAPVGQGGGSTAGRGGAAKTGGGSSNIFSIDELFPNFDGPSVIDAMLQEQNAGTDVPLPSFTDFLDPTTQQSNDVLSSLIGPEDNSLPQFAGELDPTTGLAIDPAAGSPDVVDLSGQVDAPSVIPDNPDSFDAPPPDFSEF